MATAWVKSLHCKSRASEDIVHSHLHLLPHSSSCRKSAQSLHDVVDTTKRHPRKHKPPPSRKTEKPELVNRVRNPLRPSESSFPAMTQLPEGHPSRNIVEIIFHTSWSLEEFSGRIEMVFKVQNLTRTVTRFEEYREIVKSKAVNDGSGHYGLHEDQARCVADGNEVMRFHCLGSTSGGAYENGGSTWTFQCGKGAVKCTFSGSRAAHESAGGGIGRKAMLVCRVIAGRVRKRVEFDSLHDDRLGCDSVSGENGELVVFDSRAVLPCFLVIYKL